MNLPPFDPPFVVPERYHTQPDLKKLEGRHFLLDSHFERYLRLKLEPSALHPPGGLRASSDPQGLERALWSVLEQLSQEWPEVVRVDAGGLHHRLLGLRLHRDGTLECSPQSRWTPALLEVLGDLPPLERLAGTVGLSVQEDLALLHGDRTEWLHVRFPSGWRPAEKIGQDFAALHRPVAHSAALVQAAPNLVRAMLERGPFVRFVWMLSPQGDLDQHPDLRRWDGLEPLSALELAAQSTLRFERQTTRSLPGTGRALFTIRVTVQPLGALESDPGKRHALARALRSMDEVALEYRGYAPFRDRWLAWLER